MAGLAMRQPTGVRKVHSQQITDCGYPLSVRNRTLPRLVPRMSRAPLRQAYGFSQPEKGAEGIIDGGLGGKGLGQFRVEENEVGAGAISLHVLATNSTLHRCEIVLRTHAVYRFSI